MKININFSGWLLGAFQLILITLKLAQVGMIASMSWWIVLLPAIAIMTVMCTTIILVIVAMICHE